MKHKKIKKWPLGFLFLIPLLIYGLWPLTSNKWPIEWDKQKIQCKTNFLAEGGNASDSFPRPNIILILADDLGKTDISLYGSPYLQTPHIDAIGQNGAIFQEGYISSAICSPSRAGLLTGRYQQRFGFEYQPHDRYPKNRIEKFVFKNLMNTGNWLVANQNKFPNKRDLAKQGLPPSEITIAELLKKENYKTGIIGKWHLGYSDASSPLQFGFDYHYGFYEAFTLYDDPEDPEIINQRHDDFSDAFIWGKKRNGTAAIRRNGKVIEEEEFLTSKITEEAIAFIEKNQDSAFFLYVPYLTPHTPFQITKDYFDQFSHIEDRNKRVYYAMIKSLDDAVGQLMTKLNELELAENTIVFFLSDNGGATYTKATDNAPLKGGKFSNFEGGINIPFMAQWPGTIPAGQKIKEPVISLDIFATIAELIGSPLPPNRKIDGKSLMPILRGDTTTTAQRNLCWRSGYHKAVRKGKWKMVVDEMSHQLVLYDLEKDKEEQYDLAKQFPDQVKQLKTILKNWEAELMPPLWPRVMDFRMLEKEGEFYFPL